MEAFDSINQQNGEDVEDPIHDDDDASHNNIVSEADDDEQDRGVVHEHVEVGESDRLVNFVRSGGVSGERG